MENRESEKVNGGGPLRIRHSLLTIHDLLLLCGDKTLSEMSTSLPGGKGILSELPGALHVESGKLR